ncbi:MAG: 3-hydroxyacyl-CoA dehydrogenase family protein [Hyphomicrobiaceae bacterium]
MTKFTDVAVIGAGTMGHALALVHALGGCNVRLQDVDAAALAKAPALVEAALATLVDAGAVTAAERDAAVARIVCTPDLAEAAAAADLVVEAVFEDPDIKREVFARLDRCARPDAVIASNTSHLDVFPLVPDSRQERVLIAHWYTPPYILDLVDIAPGPRTRPEIVAGVAAFYEGLGKVPVVFKSFLAGYIANRLQAAIGLEVYHLLDEGLVTAEDIDKSIIHGLATRLATLGHVMKMDYTGLDMARRSLAHRPYKPPEPRRQSPTLDRLVAAGRTGVMAGAGFYDYGGRCPTELFAERDRKLLKLKQVLAQLEGRKA